MRSKFWMVVGSGAPTYRHQTLSSATKEAERLARQNAGCEFTVLESIATARFQCVAWEKHDGSEHHALENKDEVPF